MHELRWIKMGDNSMAVFQGIVESAMREDTKPEIAGQNVLIVGKLGMQLEIVLSWK